MKTLSLIGLLLILASPVYPQCAPMLGGGCQPTATATATAVPRQTAIQVDASSNTVAAGVTEEYCNSPKNPITVTLPPPTSSGSTISIFNANAAPCTVDSGVGNLINNTQTYPLATYQSIKVEDATFAPNQWFTK